jgi:3-hydroxybutyryl-CoA dehydrogenase
MGRRRVDMRFEEVLVLGAGTIGREIALQCAMFGYRVTLYDVSRAALSRARTIIEMTIPGLAGRYVPDTVSAIKARLYYSLDLAEAAAAADLVIEAVTEDLELKRRLFIELGAVAPAHTVFTSSSSSFVPSLCAEATGRPDRFLALHFHQTVWISNIVDVMPHPGTNPAVVGRVADFARSIRQLPIMLRQERRGYVFNAMQYAYIWQALDLWAAGVATFEDIDRAWMIAERTHHGPFGTIDFVGVDTVQQAMSHWAEANNDQRGFDSAEKLQKELVQLGRLGVKSGRGFYSYPGPAYQDPTFILAWEPAAASAAS